MFILSSWRRFVYRDGSCYRDLVVYCYNGMFVCLLCILIFFKKSWEYGVYVKLFNFKIFFLVYE